MPGDQEDREYWRGENYQNAWLALRMIPEAIETLDSPARWPPARLPPDRSHRARPEPVHEGRAS